MFQYLCVQVPVLRNYGSRVPVWYRHRLPIGIGGFLTGANSGSKTLTHLPSVKPVSQGRLYARCAMSACPLNPFPPIPAHPRPVRRARAARPPGQHRAHPAYAPRNLRQVSSSQW